jgi:6-phosphogluconolactonase
MIVIRCNLRELFCALAHGNSGVGACHVQAIALFLYKMQFTRRVSRRWLLRAAAGAAGGVLLGGRARAAYHSDPEPRITEGGSRPGSYFVYTGCYTSKERGGHGEGINVYRFGTATGRWSPVQQLKGLPNPSYLAFDRTRNFLYAVHGDSSDISAYSIDSRSGKLTPLNRASTGGKNPAHLSVDPTNRWVVVANYSSSSVAVVTRNGDGTLGAIADTVTLKGTLGPHRTEQQFAKPHQVAFDPAERFIVVPDKGLDQVFTFRLDANSGKLAQIAAEAPRTRPGAGPRHVAFHPAGGLAYVANELDSTVLACRFDPATGALNPFQVLTTLPDTFIGNNTAAEIAVSADGRFVYASNRGADNIVTYSVDASTGRLAIRGWADVRGKTPRFFSLDPSGQWLLAADQDSDRIVTFRVDPGTGQLVASEAVIRTGSPVCMIFRSTAAA